MGISVSLNQSFRSVYAEEIADVGYFILKSCIYSRRDKSDIQILGDVGRTLRRRVWASRRAQGYTYQSSSPNDNS